MKLDLSGKMEKHCHLCQREIEQNEARVRCAGCSAYYHAECALLCATNRNNYYECCGERQQVTDMEVSNSMMLDETTGTGLLPPRLDTDQKRENKSTQPGPADARSPFEQYVAQQLEKLSKSNAQMNLTLQTMIGTVQGTSNSNSAAIRELENRVSTLDKKFEELNEKTKEDVAEVRAQIGQSTDIAGLATEITERVRRSANLVFYNVPEKGRSDQEIMQAIISRIPSMANLPFQIMVRRLGMQGPRARPILVTFQNGMMARACLTGRRSLPQGVGVSEDRTPEQQAAFRQLAKRKQDHNAQHPDNPMVIMYRKGEPSLILASAYPRRGENRSVVGTGQFRTEHMTMATGSFAGESMMTQGDAERLGVSAIPQPGYMAPAAVMRPGMMPARMTVTPVMGPGTAWAGPTAGGAMPAMPYTVGTTMAPALSTQVTMAGVPTGGIQPVPMSAAGMGVLSTEATFRAEDLASSLALQADERQQRGPYTRARTAEVTKPPRRKEK